ncbi:MAG: molybdenum cofactor guanylyltransferase [Chloroflexota bacterium]|nr:molybdenum cofactor guanylyltransferase [Chloroflexota bacterium]
MQPISIIILAGGRSRRMGSNKALLEISADETLIERVVSNLSVLSDDLVIVSNNPELYDNLAVRQTGDLYGGSGPLAGIHAGLTVAVNDWSLVVACDMPLVDHRLVRFMVLLTEGHDIVVPRHNGNYEPLHALYHRRCIQAIEGRLESKRRKIIGFYPDVRVRLVEQREIAIFDREGKSFSNANTPKDWQAMKAELARTAAGR